MRLNAESEQRAEQQIAIYYFFTAELFHFPPNLIMRLLFLSVTGSSKMCHKFISGSR